LSDLASLDTHFRDTVGGAVDGFFQRPYLLWFVAEDPVRNGKLPRNIAAVGNPNNALVNGNFAAADHLIKRGAKVTLAAALCLGRDEVEAPR